MERNLKKQLEFANNLKIPYVIIIGPEEVEKEVVKVRDMKERKESIMKVERFIKKVLK